jgi:hypothetical protein
MVFDARQIMLTMCAFKTPEELNFLKILYKIAISTAQRTQPLTVMNTSSTAV